MEIWPEALKTGKTDLFAGHNMGKGETANETKLSEERRRRGLKKKGLKEKSTP